MFLSVVVAAMLVFLTSYSPWETHFQWLQDPEIFGTVWLMYCSFVALLPMLKLNFERDLHLLRTFGYILCQNCEQAIKMVIYKCSEITSIDLLVWFTADNSFIVRNCHHQSKDFAPSPLFVALRYASRSQTVRFLSPDQAFGAQAWSSGFLLYVNPVPSR